MPGYDEHYKDADFTYSYQPYNSHSVERMNSAKIEEISNTDDVYNRSTYFNRFFQFLLD